MIPTLSRAPAVKLTRPIVLVGLMGAGKTTVGRRLADRLRVDFYDADEEIEASAHMRISDIFEAYGEPAFRDGERKVIERLLDGPPHILATGGGAFMNEQTRALVKERATSLWIKADLDLLVKRTSRRNHRPLLRTGDPRQILSKLLKERAPVYAKADLAVESVEGPHHKTVDKIIRALQALKNAGHPL
ncbi:MAG: shikimate kinase [Pseudomonadota bacterium]